MATALESSFVIGIGGGTASGKTTLAKLLAEALDPAVLIPLDAYYRSNAYLSPDERALRNYDHPEAFEVALLVKDLERLKSGAAIDMPVYSFETHTRQPEKIHLEPAPVIIVEGILALHWEELRNLFDLSLFVEAPESVRLERRLNRDCRERGRTRQSVLKQWMETVIPMHNRYCEPTKELAEIVIDGSKIRRKVVEEIRAKVHGLE